MRANENTILRLINELNSSAKEPSQFLHEIYLIIQHTNDGFNFEDHSDLFDSENMKRIIAYANAIHIMDLESYEQVQFITSIEQLCHNASFKCSLLKTGILTKLNSLCAPLSQIEVLDACGFFHYTVADTHINYQTLLKSLQFLITINDTNLLHSSILAYNKLFRHTHVKLEQIQNIKQYEVQWKQQTECKADHDALLTCGVLKHWISDISVPHVIQVMILKYFSLYPLPKSKLQDEIIWDPFKRWVDLLVYNATDMKSVYSEDEDIRSYSVRCIGYFWNDNDFSDALKQDVLKHGLFMNLKQNIVRMETFDFMVWFFALDIMRDTRNKIEMSVFISTIKKTLINLNKWPYDKEYDNDWILFLESIFEYYGAEDLKLLKQKANEWIASEMIQEDNKRGIELMIHMLQNETV